MTAIAWSARIDIEGAPHEDDVDTVLEQLAAHSPAIGTTAAGNLTVRIAVEATTARQAADAALRLATAAAQAANLGRTVIAVEVTRWDEFERELAQPTVPELWGLAEIAEHLEVSRSRAGQLAARDDFPPAVQRIKAGPLHIAEQVRAWTETWKRRNGRPPLTETIA
ncbi:hypothetical protein [Embleya scabrispora]|nr:hypothetical protein [Embleya scabrispora]